MSANWKIVDWPRCIRHVFLSHSAENRSSLVEPVLLLLELDGVSAFFDRRDYPAGPDAFRALREKMLECRHVVYLVTPELLGHGRGWTALELGYAELIQRNLRFEDQELLTVQLPLFFVAPDDAVLRRSVWRELEGSGAFYCLDGKPGESAAHWAVRRISRFVREQEVRAVSEIVDKVERNSDVLRRFGPSAEEKLYRRIIAADPPPTL